MPRKIKILITTAFALCLGITQALAADFTGRWEGRWDESKLYTSLTVAGANADDIQYCWNGWCRSTSTDTLHNVRIEEGTLHVKAARGDLAFNLDGADLSGTYTAHENGEVSTIRLTKAPEGAPVDHTVADFVGKWAGKWDASKSTLTITEDEPFKVKYCFRGHCRSKNLDNPRITEGDLWFAWGGQFQFSVEDDGLHGTFIRKGKLHTTTMTRKAP